MSNEVNQFEARAYKRLYELYKSTLLTIIHQTRNTIQFSSGTPEKIHEMLLVVSDEKKWNAYGIESAETTKIIDELEKCLGV